MILLQTHQISKSYGDVLILNQMNLEVRTGDRVGLVGANGAGKSTLLKIITGDLSYDEGEIFKAKDIRIGYLAQDSGLDSAVSIWEEMKQVFTSLIQQEQKLRRMESQMADPQILENEQRYQTLLDEYALVSEQFKRRGGYEYEARIQSVLHGLRFGDKNVHDPVHTLSGGQKTRLALGKLLLERPDLLILDEPTNYLDLETLAWLEQYLGNYPGALLVVSHDRYFLDHLVNIIYEIDRTKANKYYGNYTQFVQQKEATYERQLKQYEKQQQEIREMEDFIERNIARASTSKRAQGRQKLLDKMERIDRPQGTLKKASFSLEVDRPSGNDVLKVENMSIGYPGQEPLAQHLSFQVYKGERMAIVGPNGIGKTTLLKTIVGKLPPQAGHIHHGAHVSFSYYDQEQDDLQDSKTVLNEIWDDGPHLLEKDVRRLLGQFLFSGEEVHKQVHSLSGGERARLSIAKLMLKKANVLILDEPTNHLDVYSKEVLEQALLDYPGTIIFVSHDRYFLNQIATKVMELQPAGVNLYLGDYDYYMHKKDEEHEISTLQKKKELSSAAQVAHPEEEPNGKQAFEQEKERQRMERKRERRRDELEEKITELEAKIQALEQQMVLPEVYEDYQKAQEVQEQLEHIRQELEDYLEEWSELEEG